MDYIEAYKLLKKKYPEMKSSHYFKYGDLFIFVLFPVKGISEQEILDGYDESYSVNSKTGEISYYGITDPIVTLDLMDAIEKGKIIEEEDFDENDIL